MKKLLILLGIAAILNVSCFSSLAQNSPASDDLAQYRTADELANYTQQLMSPPKNSAATKEEKAKAITQALANLNAAAKEFIKRYPQDPRRWDMQLMVLMNARMMRSEGTPAFSPEEYAKGLSEIADAPNAAEPTRAMAAAQLILMAAKESDAQTFDAKISEFETKFPNSPMATRLRQLQLQQLQQNDPAQAAALLKKLAGSTNTEVAQMAADQLALADMLKKPLDLKFTATDGTEVDMAKLRGKVVLVDFWATWCGPCVAEIPHIVETYKALHDKGFEIVGISLDQNKEALEKFIKSNGMTWPQYFDGKGWKNEISTKFSIHSIPAMWLVDKNGMVVDTKARADLAAKVQAQLAK